MRKIATCLMYFPRLYITCLTLLSKLSRRERGRTYCNNIQTTSFFSKCRHNNYLDEDMSIMHFHPCKITFLCYDILHVHTKCRGKFNFLHDLFYNITLQLHKHPWNWVYINLVFVAMKLNDIFHCMVAFLNVFANFDKIFFVAP